MCSQDVLRACLSSNMQARPRSAKRLLRALKKVLARVDRETDVAIGVMPAAFGDA